MSRTGLKHFFAIANYCSCCNDSRVLASLNAEIHIYIREFVIAIILKTFS